VCAGVIVVVECAEGALWVSVVRNVSFEGFADRGLGSLPGGDESVLVKGVKVCNDAAWAGYDMLLVGVEETEAAELANELTETISFSRSLVPWS
jgi:hypothetical protein